MSIRRRYHPSRASYAYAAVTVLIALGAFSTQNNLLFWAFGLLLAFIMVSGFVSGPMLMGVRLERLGVTSGNAGEPLRVRYRVTNRNRIIPIFGLKIEEAPGAPIGTRAPKGRTATGFAFVVHLGPGRSAVVESRTTARHRGVVRLVGVRASSGFPFGLVTKSITVDQPGEFVITPTPEAVRAGMLASLTARRGDGPARSRPGDGEEFFALREYAEGDPPRRVAWRASARAGKLLTRQPAANEPRKLRLSLDLRSDASDHGQAEAERERAISLTWALILELGRRGTSVGLRIPQTGLERTPVETRLSRGRGSARAAERLGRDLAMIESDARGGPAIRPGGRAAGWMTIAIHAGDPDPTYEPGATLRLSVRADSEWSSELTPPPTPPPAPPAPLHSTLPRPPRIDTGAEP